jgi:hypothetical protein
VAHPGAIHSGLDVTIVILGKCTWARKFLDWEVQASLRLPTPNGLLAILLDERIRPPLPNRVALNKDSGYAAYHFYPGLARRPRDWIETAYAARTRVNIVNNPRERFSYNRSCA